MAPPPPREDEYDAPHDGNGVAAANGRAAEEELDEPGSEGDGEDYDEEEEDVNAAERMLEEFGGFDPPLYLQRFAARPNVQINSNVIFSGKCHFNGICN